MKKLLKVFRNTKGFTLIELLVVIGILGILAAALIATIDPFEQLKKANDANAKNTAVEFLNASIRYYTTHNTTPWADSTVTPAGCYNATTTLSGTSLTTTGARMLACMQALVGDGELKAGFTTVDTTLKTIYITGGGQSVTACFFPQSKSQQNDPNTKYTVAGVVNAACVPGTSCYWCSL
jgi:prepilin-type N-terminal cleavage/methylation domain-containing protein